MNEQRIIPILKAEILRRDRENALAAREKELRITQDASALSMVGA